MMKPCENQVLKVRQFIILLFHFIGLTITVVLPDNTAATPINPQSTNSIDTLTTRKDIETIPLSSVASEGQKAAINIRNIRSKVEKIYIEVDLDSLLLQVDSSFKVLRDRAFKDSLQDLNLHSLEDYYRDFSQIKSRLLSSKKMIIEKYNLLQPNLESTTQMLKLWSNTKDQLSNEDVPDPIWERIDSYIKEIGELNHDIIEKQNYFLVQEDRITTMIISVEEVISKVNSKIQLANKQFLTLNSPSFWSMFNAENDSVSVIDKAKKSFKSQKKDIQSFGNNYQENIRNQILIFLALFIILLYFKHRVNKWTIDKEDNHIQAALYVIRNPLIAALAIAILITPFNFPEAPQTVTRLIYLLSIILVFYLIPVLIPFLNRVYIYLFSVLILLSEISLFFEGYFILDRIFLLVFDLSAIIILAYSIRPHSSLITSLQSKQMHFAITLLRFTFILFLIGFVSNIIGLTVMSSILSHGAFIIYFSGILIYGGSMVLKSLVKLLIISDLSKNLNIFKKYPDDISKGLNYIINVIAALYLLVVNTRVFLIYNPIMKWLDDFISKKWQIGEVEITLGSFLAFFITLWIAVFLSKIIRILLKDEILIRLNMKKGMPGAISMMVRIALVTLGLILACSAAGIKLNNITIIFGALGVGIGFGLQNIVNNFISGLIIAFERPIRNGDIIQIATLNLKGEVIDIGIRSSIIKTYEGAEVIVPNGNLISSEMINWTLSDRNSRRELQIGVKYGTDINNVLRILNETVANHKDVHKDPPPWIIFTGFGENSLNFRIMFWTTFDNGLTILSAVGAAIDVAFKKEGIQIPFPQRVLHMDSGDSVIPQ